MLPVVPKCPVCRWSLRFTVEDPGRADGGHVWQAWCWNKHCPEQDTGPTRVSPERALA